MHAITSLIELTGGQKSAVEGDGPARRTRLALMATAASCVGASLFGLAAGSADGGLAAANLLKLPMVVVLSAVAALPAGLLAWKVTDAKIRVTDLLVSLAAANMTATMVLTAAAPLVALYYVTDSTWGGPLAMGTCFLAIGVGGFTYFRAIKLRLPEDVSRRQIWIPLAVLIIFQLIALVQLVGIASPILPEVTPFSGGADGLVTF
jgi:hypothetical protein